MRATSGKSAASTRQLILSHIGPASTHSLLPEVPLTTIPQEMTDEIKVGIIGGTGLDRDSEILQDQREVSLETTPFGDPSDRVIVEGKIAGITVYIIGRHGKTHNVNPSNVNYRANLWSLRTLGCTHVLVTTACGSLKEKIAPGHVVILDQYIDRTSGRRSSTFYTVAHIPQNRPFDRKMQQILEQACIKHNVPHHTKGVAVVIEGPRFSTLAESRLHQSWGCDIVNMTAVPEAPLAAELGLVYASLALVTDYDGWHESEEEHVSVDLVTIRMKDLGSKAKKVLAEAVSLLSQCDWSQEIAAKREQSKSCIMFL